MVDISIVIPVFDEKDSLRELHAKMSDVMRTMGRSYEIVFVDDGSRDGSLKILEDIHREFNVLASYVLPQERVQEMG